MIQLNSEQESKDEVDFIHTKSSLINKDIQQQQQSLESESDLTSSTQQIASFNNKLHQQCPVIIKKLTTPGTLYGDCEVKTSIKSSLSTLEKLSFFTTLQRRRHNQNVNININNNNNNNININNNNYNNNNNNNKSENNIKETSRKNKFVKSASIARLLGNTYNTKKIENELLKLKKNHTTNSNFHYKNSNPNNYTTNYQFLQKNQFNINKLNCNNQQYIHNNNNNNNSYNLLNANPNSNPNNCHNLNSYNSYNNINNGVIRNERFQKCTKLEENDDDTTIHNNSKFNNHLNCNQNFNELMNLNDFHDDQHSLTHSNTSNDLSTKAFRTISRSLGKLMWKRTHSVEISQPDPEFKVSYLGNVLTGWAKGDGCVEKPLNTLWRNYNQNHKPDVIMRIKICASGLKATTRQHGLTEYWANRITHCCSPKNYPRVFCWIYRHEGRKMKHELRCHAVLCNKEIIAQDICNTLRENLDRALSDFKREKILKQNARLSLANSVYENPSLPRRKILLSVGGNNYRPPMERSKSAPKLMAIEEAIGEEEGEEIEQTNEPEMAACCQKDSLYPAMTLGRRRCRRGHSIRRTGKAFKSNCGGDCSALAASAVILTEKPECSNAAKGAMNVVNENSTTTKTNSSLAGSEEDDLDKLLSYNNYDTESPLAGELLSYFDMKLHAKTSSLTDLREPGSLTCDQNNVDYDDDNLEYSASLTTDPSPRPRPSLSLDNLDNCSDGDCGGDCLTADEYDEDYESEDQLFFRQSTILNLLHRNSMRKLANLSMSSDDSSIDPVKTENCHDDEESRRFCRSGSIGVNRTPLTMPHMQHMQHRQHLDSDEGSISSGCETASTVTTNLEESSLKYLGNLDDQTNTESLKQHEHREEEDEEEVVTSLPIETHKQRYLNSINNPDESIKFSNRTTLTFKIPKIPKRLGSNETTTTTTTTNNNNNFNYHNQFPVNIHQETKKNHLPRNANNTQSIGGETNSAGSGDVSDSEFSDESGYVEYQDQCALRRAQKIAA